MKDDQSSAFVGDIADQQREMKSPAPNLDVQGIVDALPH
jgi:hypothetical protein